MFNRTAFLNRFVIQPCSGKNVRSWCDGSSDRSFMVDPLSYFSFQAVVYGMMHIKEPLMLIGKSSPCGGSGFLYRYLNGPFPYVCSHITVNKNVLSASLNKTFPSFLQPCSCLHISLKLKIVSIIIIYVTTH